MNFLWEVKFYDGTYGYVGAPNVLEAAKKAQVQNWNQDIQNAVGIEMVDNGFSEDTTEGWYSGNA